MAIPKLKKQDVIDALKFIDENGVPEHNTSVKYVLVSEDGKKYPPKYVVAVADHLANSTDISTESFNSVDAKNYLKSLGFSIETKQQEKFELSITAESVESTDERFTMDNLSLGDNYKPLDAYFKRANGDVIKRAYSKGERRNSNQTLPRIACQVFEKQLAALSVEDKENFPVCKYNPGSDVIRGIYASVDDFKNRRNTIEYLTYGYDNGRQFVIYCYAEEGDLIFTAAGTIGQVGMLYDRSIQVSNTNRISVYDELSTFFIAFHFRGTCLSLDEFNDLHGFHFEKDPTNFNIDHLISLCEYIENLLIAYQCVSLSYPYEYGNMPTNLINVQFYLQQISQVIEKIGYMQAKQNDLTIFVEKDPAAIAVAEGEFIPESLSYRLISYNHYSMKGNLAEKKTTLLDLANLLEPQRTILERIDKTFSSDLFYTFNNFHIRHNNIDQLGTKYKKPVGDLSDEQLEYWYDEVYQMCLLAFMRLEHIDRKKKFDSLKSQIEGT